jgi:hypothetical protein
MNLSSSSSSSALEDEAITHRASYFSIPMAIHAVAIQDGILRLYCFQIHSVFRLMRSTTSITGGSTNRLSPLSIAVQILGSQSAGGSRVQWKNHPLRMRARARSGFCPIAAIAAIAIAAASSSSSGGDFCKYCLDRPELEKCYLKDCNINDATS